MRILHFADAHIDIAGHGRHDAQSGLPLRVLDFLKSMDTIVDTAIQEKVDLVIFAGDAYKDRTPVPTFQREWGRRILSLSQAGIPTLLLVGNHDLSPAVGRAHALQEFDTLQVPHIHVLQRPALLKPGDLEGLPLQVIALPWISRSNLMASMELSGLDASDVYEHLEERLDALVKNWLENEVDPRIPTLLTAHTSVQGAKYGAERSVMLGNDLVLSRGLVCDPRLAYTALGHIHKAQDLNEGSQPPVIYPGSIERVDFGEIADEKYFVIATLENGQPTQVSWRKLQGRKFIDRSLKITSSDLVMDKIMAFLPSQEILQDAMVRLTLDYPRELETQIDEPRLRRYAEQAFEFHFIRRPQVENRIRLPDDRTISSLTPFDLLDIYWKSVKTSPSDAEVLNKLAEEIISSASIDEV
jgi:DNA repair protein SbcD/Mre11